MWVVVVVAVVIVVVVAVVVCPSHDQVGYVESSLNDLSVTVQLRLITCYMQKVTIS